MDGVVPVFINSDKMFNPSLNNFRNNDEEEPLENLVYDCIGETPDGNQCAFADHATNNNIQEFSS